MLMQLDLNGSWTLTCPPADGAPAFSLPALVPGNVELDLCRAGIEPEPFYAENEYCYGNYEAFDWRFVREISLPALPDEERVVLIFEELNCIADIFVSDQWAGDNEADEGYADRGYRPLGNVYNVITREALPRAVRENDPFRLFLPSSPYIDGGIARYDVPRNTIGARAQTPICVMLDEHAAWSHEVVVGNDSRAAARVSHRLLDADTREALLSGEAFSPANENISVGEIRALPGQKRLVLLEWWVNGARFVNHYLTGFPPYAAKDGARWAKKINDWGERA